MADKETKFSFQASDSEEKPLIQVISSNNAEGQSPVAKYSPGETVSAGGQDHDHIAGHIRKEVKSLVKQPKAVDAFMDAVYKTQTHEVVLKAFVHSEIIDGRKVSLLVQCLAVYLQDENQCRECYLPLFTLGRRELFLPLIAEMFGQLRSAVPDAVTTVFRKDSNRGTKTYGLNPKYLLQKVLQRFVEMGALVADEYRQLLICSPSELWFDDFGWNVLWYAEAEYIDEVLRGEVNEQLLANAPDASRSHAAEVLNRLTEEDDIVKVAIFFRLSIKKELANFPDRKIAAGAQVLKMLLVNPEIEPRTAGYIANKLDLQSLEVDPLIGGSDDPSAVTLAAGRGPGFTEAAVRLFEVGCRRTQTDINSSLEQLISEHIDDTALAAVFRNAAKNHPGVMLNEDLLQKCVGEGHVSAAAELHKLQPDLTDPFMEMLRQDETCPTINEGTLLRALEELDPDLYSSQCTYEGVNSLHLAAYRGYTALTKQILARGYTKLLWVEDATFRYPIQHAMALFKWSTAALLLRNMGSRAVSLFKRDGDNPPRIQLYNLLVEHQREKEAGESTGKLKKLILAALDTTISGHHVDHELLEADENGYTPDHQEFQGPSCYEFITKNGFEDLQTHESFSTLVNMKWLKYGVILQSITFILYVLFMVFLTTSLVLAARSRDPRDYDKPLDMFRAFCEIITILWVLVDVSLEFYDLYTTYKKRKLHKKAWQNFLHALWNHITDWQNSLDALAILTALLILPCRITNSDWQWVFASLTYIFHGLKIFKYAVMFVSVGVYVAILKLVIWRDFLQQFLFVFMVVLISFGGGLYLALRGETVDNGSNNSTSSSDFDPVDDTSLGIHSEDTKEIHLVWLTVIRILAEGSVIDYYGPGGYQWLGVIIYWLLLFTVVVILLNILIAQFSHSYEEQRQRAQHSVTLTRARLIDRMETLFWAKRMLQIIKAVRINDDIEPNICCCEKPVLKVVRILRARFGKESSFNVEVKRSEAKDSEVSSQLQVLDKQLECVGVTISKQLADNRRNLAQEKTLAKLQTRLDELEAKMQAKNEQLEKDMHKMQEVLQRTWEMLGDVKELLQTSLQRTE